jgi:hypothetical protein
MRPKLGLLVLAITVAIAAFVAPTAGAQSSLLGSPTAVTQNLVGTAGGLAYNLTATVTQIVDTGAGLGAVGTVTGTVTDTATGAVTTVDQVLATPVTAAAWTSGGMLGVTLGLGPVSVDPLGQSVALSPIQVGLGSSLISGVLGEILSLLGLGGIL